MTLAARGRDRAEALMTSTCVVSTAGIQVTDASTGEVTTSGTIIWSGACRVRPAVTGLAGLAQQVGGTESFKYNYHVSIPFSVTAVLEGHRLAVTAGPDPSLIGLVLEIQRVDRGDSITARRLICQRVS